MNKQKPPHKSNKSTTCEALPINNLTAPLLTLKYTGRRQSINISITRFRPAFTKHMTLIYLIKMKLFITVHYFHRAWTSACILLVHHNENEENNAEGDMYRSPSWMNPHLDLELLLKLGWMKLHVIGMQIEWKIWTRQRCTLQQPCWNN